MRKMTRLFLAAEALDLITTVAGLALGAAELHPAGFGWRVLVCKALVVVVVVVCLERLKLGRAGWVLPAVAALPVVWNLAVIASEVLL
jgi:hypothetical protein